MIAEDVKGACDQIVSVVTDLATSNKQALTQVQSLTDQLGQVKSQLSQLQAKVGKKVLVFDACEKQPWLVAGGTAANSGQIGSTAADSQGQPTATSAAFLHIGPNGAWADKYWYQQKGVHNEFDTYLFEIDILFADAAAAAVVNCVELDIQQVITGQVFNTGLQLNFSGNMLRVWDRSAATPTATGKGDWVPIGVPCPRLAPGKWTKLVLETHREGNQVVYDGVSLGGVRTVPTINSRFTAPVLGFKTDAMNHAVQLDSSGAGVPFTLFIDNVRFTISQR